MIRCAAVFLIATAACGAARRAPAARERTLERTCTRCHGINVVHAQRLTREEWNRELQKMTLMGARITDRKALLDYLATTYGPRRR